MKVLSKSLLTVALAWMTVAPARAIPDGTALASAFLAVRPGLCPSPEGVKDRILAATKMLVEPPDASFTKEKLVASLSEIMDIVAGLAADNPHQQDIRYRIDVATDLMKNDSLFNPKARQYMSFAYRMLTGGKRYQAPAELADFVTPAELQEKSSRYLRGLIAQTLESLDAGDKDSAAALLLEIVLMTVSPVQG